MDTRFIENNKTLIIFSCLIIVVIAIFFISKASEPERQNRLLTPAETEQMKKEAADMITTMNNRSQTQ